MHKIILQHITTQKQTLAEYQLSTKGKCVIVLIVYFAFAYYITTKEIVYGYRRN